MKLPSSIDVEMVSIHLGRFYLSPSYMYTLGNSRVSVILKKISTLNGSQKWKDKMKEYVRKTMTNQEPYHQRSNL